MYWCSRKRSIRDKKTRGGKKTPWSKKVAKTGDKAREHRSRLSLTGGEKSYREVHRIPTSTAGMVVTNALPG